VTVAAARAAYAAVASEIVAKQAVHFAGRHPAEAWRCPDCHALGLEIEAASLAVDLRVAEASQERIRGSVAWA
jgi:hypothetical protein